MPGGCFRKHVSLLLGSTRSLWSLIQHMPRISAAHEQQVRDRIIQAAVTVFSEKGYHRATISDVVRRSGLSVGAS
jgi:hypothetical protein